MLSQRTRYTIRAMLHLADRYGQGPVQLSEIAVAQNIPPKFLTVMLSQMSRKGLVGTRRGRDGGYWLARPPREISYGEIVRQTRGSLGLLPCASRNAYESCKHCISEDKCRLHRVMLMVRDETARILDGLSLADPVPEVPFDDPLEAGDLDDDPEQGAAARRFLQGDRTAVGKDQLPRQA
jgi:Rrf2 family protein